MCTYTYSHIVHTYMYVYIYIHAYEYIYIYIYVHAFKLDTDGRFHPSPLGLRVGDGVPQAVAADKQELVLQPPLADLRVSKKAIAPC